MEYVTVQTPEHGEREYLFSFWIDTYHRNAAWAFRN